MYNESPSRNVAEPAPGAAETHLHDLAAAEEVQPVLRPAASLAGNSDFLPFFGLQELPFSDAVNPKYYYKTDGHDEAFIRLLLAIRHDISLGLVTGPSGSGKTLLSQLILQGLDPLKHEAALVLVSPDMSKTALLRAILDELEVTAPDGPFVSAQELLRLLQNRVIDLHHQGKKLVILVDECHFLPADTLHMVRTISNLEVPERKLVSILLFGEDRFLKRLEHPSYESLRNRMYLRSELRPMDLNDTTQYIKFRLLIAGRMDDLFAETAFAVVHELSGGVCRRVNKLCTLALIEGFLRRQATLDAAVVRACADRL